MPRAKYILPTKVERCSMITKHQTNATATQEGKFKVQCIDDKDTKGKLCLNKIYYVENNKHSRMYYNVYTDESIYPGLWYKTRFTKVKQTAISEDLALN